MCATKKKGVPVLYECFYEHELYTRSILLVYKNTIEQKTKPRRQNFSRTRFFGFRPVAGIIPARCISGKGHTVRVESKCTNNVRVLHAHARYIR